ncbi:MAG: ribulose-phosphate 3-epimerase [Prevotellaceae bacterium]|jgi:ribulose-phosphate 3-epimerase|nr:ribulose-phosphate 3-epimerase [Prevotellaceae bacterium]
MMNKMLSPSILTANFGVLQQEIEMLNESCADMIHLDVMDGTFVPNISFGLPVVKAVARIARKPLDVHLMMIHPEKYIEDFRDAGAAFLTVHLEACSHLASVTEQIKSLGMKAGAALNPHTPVAMLEDIIGELDLLLVMSVNPGFGGQRFIPFTIEKIRRARELARRTRSETLIEVDGGISLDNAAEVYAAGADILVAGSAIFSSDNPADYMKKLKTV